MSNQIVVEGELTRGPLSDPESYFVAINVEDTSRVMEALRKAGIEFDVSVNPNPGEGQALCDIIWLWRQANQASIQRLIKDVLTK